MEQPWQSGFEMISCCYACKLTMSYDEAGDLNDEWYLGHFNLENRGKNPSSCAEVALHLALSLG